MYKFREINEYRDNYYLSSVAMLFNDFLIEYKLDDYHTLAVSGRETLTYNVDLESDISGRDGAVIKSKSLQPRYLEITYKLTAKNNKELQEKYRWLTYYLDTTEDVPIKFRDDMDTTYYGQLIEINDIPKDRNEVIGTFRILCSDPYKYNEGGGAKGNPVQVYLDSPYSSKPEEIIISVGKNAKKIIVRNETTGRRIILNGDYKKSNRIKINIEDNEITKNGENIMAELDYTETDFHAFVIKSGDIVSVSPSSSDLELKLKSRWK